MRRSIHLLSLLLGLVCTSSPRLLGQPSEARGLVVYKPTPQDPEERALVAEFKEIKFFPNIVNGRKVDGAEFRIVSGAFLDFIEYPDLSKGVFRTSEQVESLKSIGRKMVAISEKFSSAQEFLSPRIEQLKIAAEKFNAGMILSNGEFMRVETTPPPMINPDRPKENDNNGNSRRTFFSEGRNVSGLVKNVFPDAILLQTESGLFRVLLSEQSDEIQKEFNYDRERERVYLEARATEAATSALMRVEKEEERKRRETAENFSLNVSQSNVEGGFLAYRMLSDGVVKINNVPTILSKTGQLYLVRFCNDIVLKARGDKDFGVIADGDKISGTGYITDDLFVYESVGGSTKTVRTLWLFRCERR